MRFVPAWRDNLLLRLQLVPSDGFQIHAFAGARGVTLRYRGQSPGWLAYVTRRQLNQPRPAHLIVQADDAGRAQRSEFGQPVPIGMHYRDGQWVVTRGDLILLSAPLPQPPQEIYFDGTADLQAIDVHRCDGLPVPGAPHAAQLVPPAALEWQQPQGAAASRQMLAGGAVAWQAEQASEPTWLTAKVPRSAPQELIVQLDGVQPGTGFLLAPHGPLGPGIGIAFVHQASDGPLYATWCQFPLGAHQSWLLQLEPPEIMVGSQIWLRLTTATSTVRGWISSDGTGWAELPGAPGPASLPLTQLGLYHAAGSRPCRVILQSVSFASYPSLVAQAPAAMRQQALQVIVDGRLPVVDDLTQWDASVRATCPASVSLESWHAACTVAALTTGCHARLASVLLQRLLDRSRDAGATTADQWRLLEEVGRIVDPQTMALAGDSLATRYLQLARQACRRDNVPPARWAWRAVVRSSCEPGAAQQYVWSEDGVVRDEILHHVYHAQWQQLRELCGQLHYLGLLSHDLLVRWADQCSAAQLQTQPWMSDQRRPRVTWHALLREDLDRELFSQLEELQQWSQAGNWSEAASQAAQTMWPGPEGLAPAPDDQQLLVSSDVAIQRALRRWPALAQQLDQYGPMLQLQLMRNIEQRDVPHVRRLAARYAPLPVAREAETWLGDQQLARGNGPAALRHYLRAAPPRGEESGDREPLLARQALASALAGTPPALNRPVQLGDYQLTPEDFQLASTALAVPAYDLATLPQASVVLTRRLALPLDVGKDPSQEVLRGIDSGRLDWTGRQLVSTRADDLLLVHNRFELVALRADTGDFIWTNHPLPNAPLRSRDWPLIPMRPQWPAAWWPCVI